MTTGFYEKKLHPKNKKKTSDFSGELINLPFKTYFLMNKGLL